MFFFLLLIFYKIADKLKLLDDLKSCFSSNYEQILSIAYYLILEDNNSLFRFEKWETFHKYPCGSNITL